MNNEGTLVISPIRPQSPSDKIPVALNEEVKGGFHHVTTILERDAIYAERRSEGMWCYVMENNTIYTLRGGIGNINWVSYKPTPTSFKQTTPSAKWEIKHNLGYIPITRIIGPDRCEMMVAVEHSEDMMTMWVDFEDTLMTGSVEFI